MKIDQTASLRGQPVVVWLCLVAWLGLGLAIYRDYGISYDEGVSRLNGYVSAIYLLSMLPTGLQEALLGSATLEKLRLWPPPLHEYPDRDYGVVFELPAALGEYVFGLTGDDGATYLYRHLLTFLVCIGGIVAVYQLGARRFHDWRMGLLGASILVLSPRLFADFFYNSKDAVFLAFFAIGLNTLVRFLLYPTWRRAAAHALACALAIDLRIVAVLLPVVTIALLVIRGLRGDFVSRQLWRCGLLYCGLLLVCIIAMWPYLWEAPLDNFVQAFRNMAHFRWGKTVLYRAKMVRASELPWHYVPVWIGITTPPLYLLACGVGLVAIGRQLIRSGWSLYRCDEAWQDLLFLGMVLGPIVLVIVLHSELYDGWRHLYFIYPAFVLVAVRGLVAVWQWKSARRSWRIAMTSLVAAALLFTARQMVWLHPFEHVYFNVLAGRKDLERRYELDYWYLSYRQGLEWIVRHDDRPQIRVNFNAPLERAVRFNRLLLPIADRERIIIEADAAQADYLITNYRLHPLDYEYSHEVARLFAGDLRILSVFRLRS